MPVIIRVDPGNEVGGGAGITVDRETGDPTRHGGLRLEGLRGALGVGVRDRGDRLIINQEDRRRGSRNRGVQIGVDRGRTQCPVIEPVSYTHLTLPTIYSV